MLQVCEASCQSLHSQRPGQCLGKLEPGQGFLVDLRQASFFRDVLAIVAAALGETAIGPITGDVPPVKRQALIDEFAARRSPSVLVAQVQAGGVGVNIQAASVVIITEPQWNPAVEEQAIARAHRMGQVRRVDVHRLYGRGQR